MFSPSSIIIEPTTCLFQGGFAVDIELGKFDMMGMGKRWMPLEGRTPLNIEQAQQRLFTCYVYILTL